MWFFLYLFSSPLIYLCIYFFFASYSLESKSNIGKNTTRICWTFQLFNCYHYHRPVAEASKEQTMYSRIFNARLRKSYLRSTECEQSIFISLLIIFRRFYRSTSPHAFTMQKIIFLSSRPIVLLFERSSHEWLFSSALHWPYVGARSVNPTTTTFWVNIWDL